jgi:hypothetical protein
MPTHSAPPKPMLPDYSGRCIRGIVPALLAPAPRGVAFGRQPGWMPAQVGSARAVVVLVLDGLGWDQLCSHAALCPTLASMTGAWVTSVAPSTTATALTSITTGLTPGEHGLVGYRLDLGGGVVMNTLRWWTDRDARPIADPSLLQPFAPFLGERVPVVSKAELQDTAFTQAHLRGSVPRGWRAASSICPQVRQLVAAGERFVYAYYDGIDKIAHERGFGEYYDAELRTADRLVGDLLEALPADTVLLVTADHGQVHVGQNTLSPHADVRALTRYSSGEGRFRWLHARPGAEHDLLAASEVHADVAWVVSRQQVIDEGWFGPVVSPPIAARLGDVALVAHADVSFDDPADSGLFPLVCRHGSLTPAEMKVPLLSACGTAHG